MPAYFAADKSQTYASRGLALCADVSLWSMKIKNKCIRVQKSSVMEVVDYFKAPVGNFCPRDAPLKMK